MSSPVATVGLFYDSDDLQQSDLSIFLQIMHGLNEPPQVRGTDSIVPALAGRSEGIRVNDILQIELVGIVQADQSETVLAAQRASFRTNATVLRNLFRTNRLRAPLVAILEDGTILTIDARPINAIWNERVPGQFAEVSIQLEGYDDWAEDAGS